MTDLNDYFDPVSIESPEFEYLSLQAGFPHNIVIHTENLPLKGIDTFKVALMGVPEGRNSPASGSMKDPTASVENFTNWQRFPVSLK